MSDTADTKQLAYWRVTVDIDVVALDVIEEMLAGHAEAVALGACAAPVVHGNAVRLIAELSGHAERRHVPQLWR